MAPKALAVAAFGARGTGKTEWVKRWVASLKARRLLVWDYKHDPSLRIGMGEPVSSLGALARQVQDRAFALRYMVNHNADPVAQFDMFCRIAYAAGDLVMFVDELPEVTKANRAPPAWKKCVNVGREYMDEGRIKSLTIAGAAQRPAEVDKTFMANLDIIHTGRLGDMGDARRIAMAWGIKPEELAQLPDLHWIEKRADKPNLERGVLTFKSAKKQAEKPTRPSGRRL